jgi:hypothetical protein
MRFKNNNPKNDYRMGGKQMAPIFAQSEQISKPEKLTMDN